MEKGRKECEIVQKKSGVMKEGDQKQKRKKKQRRRGNGNELYIDRTGSCRKDGREEQWRHITCARRPIHKCVLTIDNNKLLNFFKLMNSKNSPSVFSVFAGFLSRIY